MELEFTMKVVTEEYLTGRIYNQIIQQGMTCMTRRPFEMRFID